MKSLSSQWYAALSLLLLMLAGNPASAQTFYPATIPDPPFANPNVQCASLNCDMLELSRFTGTVQAVAWSDRLNGFDQAFFAVRCSGGGFVQDTLPRDSKNPDIVIADDFLYPVGYVFIVAVVYECQGAIFLNTYRLWNVPSTAPFLVPISAQAISSGFPVASPHIDLFADNVNLVPWSNLPSMHEFVICWQEQFTGGPYDMVAVNGDVSAPTTLTPLTLLPTNISMPDVSCFTDLSTGIQHAAFMYIQVGPGPAPVTTDYDVLDYNVTSTFPITTVTVEPTQTLGVPRIEALSLYDPLSGDAPWMGVGSVLNGGLYETRMYDANNVGTPVSLSGPLANGVDNILPAIGVGTGDAATGTIGNNQYTAILMPTGNSYAFATGRRRLHQRLL